MEITPEQRERWAARDENRRFKAWIDPHVCENGRLSLRLLYDFARKHGVPIDEAAYTGLNPGQIRMNVGNRIRAACKAESPKP